MSVKTHFWASHQLTLPDGSKEPSHRHDWSVIADVSSDKLNSMGLVMDFCLLTELVEKIVAQFDNIPLDSIDYFRQNTPSAENAAKYIYEKLKPVLPPNVKLEAVSVTEHPGCLAKYSP